MTNQQMSFRGLSRKYLIVLVCCALASCSSDSVPSASNTGKFGFSEIVDPRMDEYLTEMTVQERFTGVALVAQNGEILHAKGYGEASPGQPNTVDTVFHVASITKQFTAAAILQLAESGAIDLSLSINNYLPAHYRSSTWDEVSVHHVLSHSSGIPDYGVTRDYYDVVDGFCLGNTVDGMIREAMSSDLEFKPGSEYSYSNIGFTLLGEIIEEQTSTSYEQYIQERIFEPLGMRSSTIHIEGHLPVENEATGHRWDEEKQKHVKDDVVSLPVTAPDGGMVTTLSDFLRWIPIYSGSTQSVLSKASIDAMTARQIPAGLDGELDAYGYGLDVGDRLIGHSGYIVGFRSRFDYARENQSLIVVFTNNTTNSPERISADLLTILFTPES